MRVAIILAGYWIGTPKGGDSATHILVIGAIVIATLLDLLDLGVLSRSWRA